MVTNFDFLKKIDKNLYEIISDAEMLYRDEYFEQCMSQTRRFAENVCKKVLGARRTSETTFDQMLATLKDKSQGSEQEKEFIQDLYFLKKCGNASVHSASVKKNALEALECLQRAFEVAINYSVYTKNANRRNLSRDFDIELLATGQKTTRKTLAQKYENEKIKAKKHAIIETKKKKNTSKKSKQQKQISTMTSCKRPNKISNYWIGAGIFSIISLVVALILLII